MEKLGLCDIKEVIKVEIFFARHSHELLVQESGSEVESVALQKE